MNCKLLPSRWPMILDFCSTFPWNITPSSNSLRRNSGCMPGTVHLELWECLGHAGLHDHRTSLEALQKLIWSLSTLWLEQWSIAKVHCLEEKTPYPNNGPLLYHSKVGVYRSVVQLWNVLTFRNPQFDAVEDEEGWDYRLIAVWGWPSGFAIGLVIPAITLTELPVESSAMVRLVGSRISSQANQLPSIATAARPNSKSPLVDWAHSGACWGRESTEKPLPIYKAIYSGYNSISNQYRPTMKIVVGNEDWGQCAYFVEI